MFENERQYYVLSLIIETLAIFLFSVNVLKGVDKYSYELIYNITAFLLILQFILIYKVFDKAFKLNYLERIYIGFTIIISAFIHPILASINFILFLVYHNEVTAND